MKYLDPKTVLFLEAKTREEALTALVAQLDKAKKLKDRDAFLNAVLKREELVSTGIGMGVAIPHAKLPGYKQFFIAIGVQKGEGIPWDAVDGAPVKLIFLIGGPEEKQNEYLQILSSITIALKSEEKRKAAINAQTPEELIELFAHS